MATPAWFNEVEYLNAKLGQLIESNSGGDRPIGPDGFPYTNISQVAAAFEAAGLTALEHYNMYGSKEELNPSKIFSSQEYCLLKLRQLQTEGTDAEKAAWGSSKWEDVRYSIHKAGMSMGEHYTNYGAAEGVPMSNSFDTNAYLTAKLAALIADTAVSATWTGKGIKDVAKAISDAGMDPYTHYITYGGAANEVAANLPFGVANPVHPEGTGGNTIRVKSGEGNYGTAGNDIFNADSMGANTFVDGAAGWDTLNLNDSNSLKGVTLKSVEEVRSLLNQNGIDLSKNTDVQKFWAVDSTAVVTAALTQQIGFEGGINGASTVTFMGAEGDDDKATIALNGADFQSSATGVVDLLVLNDADVDNRVETLTLDLAGKNMLDGIASSKVQNLVITGEGSLQQNAKTGQVLLGSAVDGTTGVLSSGTAKALKSIDASDATGTLNLTVGTGDLASEFAYTGSTGNDSLIISSASNAKALTIDLGAGDNSLSLEGGAHKNSTFTAGDSKEDSLSLNDYKTVTPAVGATFTGFEHLTLAGVTNYEIGNIKDISTYTLGDGATSITKMVHDSTVTIQGPDSGNSANLRAASSLLGEIDLTLNLKFNNGSSVDAAGADTELTTDFKLLKVSSDGNVDSGTGHATANSLTLATANATVARVLISGGEDFEFITGTATKLVTIDGREATGDLRINASGNGSDGATAATALNIYGGAGDDTIIGDGATGSNLIIGGAGGDKITLVDNTIVDTIKLSKGDSLADNMDYIAGFRGTSGSGAATDDVIDLISLGSTTKNTAGVDGASVEVSGVYSDFSIYFTVKNADTFFDTNRVMVKGYTESGTSNSGALVLIDSNKDGAWNAADDDVLVLTGINANTIETNNFAFVATP